MKQFNANMLARTTEKVPLGPDAQIRENTKVVVLADSKWSTVNRVLRGIYADAIKGNVIEHVAAATGIQRQVISIDLSPSFTPTHHCCNQAISPNYSKSGLPRKVVGEMAMLHQLRVGFSTCQRSILSQALTVKLWTV